MHKRGYQNFAHDAKLVSYASSYRLEWVQIRVSIKSSHESTFLPNTSMKLAKIEVAEAFWHRVGKMILAYRPSSCEIRV